MKQIVALVGPAGSGKTTLARLMEPCGFTRTSFAAPIKTMLASLLFYQNAYDDLVHRMLDGDLKEVESALLANRTPRHAMQTLGTEWRDLINRRLWLFVWRESVEGFDKVVVDDMRFQHEADFVRAFGGKIFRVQRPGTMSGLHVSEREYEIIHADGIIENNRDLEYMLAQLNYLLDGEVP